MKIRGLYAIFGVMLILSVMACSPAATDLNTDDEIAIYAAVVRQVTGPDDTFGGEREKPIIYIYEETSDTAGDPSQPQAEPRELPADVREGISAALSDLPSEIRWIESLEQVEMNEMGQIVDGGVIVTLGNIHPQAGGEIQVAGSIYIANLAAGGATYLLEKQESIWMITGTTGVRWIS